MSVSKALRHHRQARGAGISLLVPLQANRHSDRAKLWSWLRRYWRHELPAAEIVIGRDDGVPFSKTAAVNVAASRARGDVLVILDADAYVDGELLTDCASEIRAARETERRLWFVPYRRFYRLGPEATRRILNSRPRHPVRPTDPPPASDLDQSHVDTPNYGHHFAAMTMVLPVEAFKQVGGMDPRFRGWGGEDISFLRAVDTVYSPHKTCDNAIFHLYHEKHVTPWGRTWRGQMEHQFGHLGSRYKNAEGDARRMLRLAAEGLEHQP